MSIATVKVLAKPEKRQLTEEAARTICALLAQYTALEEGEIFKKSAKLSEEQVFQ
jgi:hypothetical protein